jgi:hypothetical protein
VPAKAVSIVARIFVAVTASIEDMLTPFRRWRWLEVIAPISPLALLPCARARVCVCVCACVRVRVCVCACKCTNE